MINREENNYSRLLPTFTISLFFLWALTSNLLPVLIPYLKKACHLNILEASLIDSSYWIAYFVIAFPAGLLMKRKGYKTAIVAGLLLAATGAFLFYPAAESRTFLFFLLALFVLASGMTILETSANPLITLLGSNKTGSRRLNFAQAFNGLGAFLATMFLSKLIISKVDKTPDQISLLPQLEQGNYYTDLFHKVKMPYICISLVLMAVAIVFLLTKFPAIKKGKDNLSNKFSASEKNQVTWGVIAQFFYVGAQVCVSSFFMMYAEKAAGISGYVATNYLGLLLFFFMIGRYAGTFLMKFVTPEKLIITYATINIGLMLYIVAIGGYHAVWVFAGVEFFMSIMYPTIFALTIRDLGTKVPYASSLLVMAIIGGAVFPPLLGFIADRSNIQSAYIVPLICFFPVLWYGTRMNARSYKVANEPMVLVS
jgi:FHS family L-fucose permease-like MFS transporter